MRTTKILVLSFLLALTLAATGLTLSAQDLPPRGDDADRPSKNGRTEGTIDGTNIVITYGRPNVKDRAVWGALVPNGQVWRAGANEATVISFSTDVQIEGQKLPAGVYGFFVIPGEGEWTVIFNKTAKQWGHFNYDASQDALRVKVKPRAHDHVESMDFVIEGGSVVLRWEKLGVGFEVASAN